MESGKAAQVPELLGKEFRLQSLYPERKEFHIDEILSYHSTVVRYFIEVDDGIQAFRHLNLLNDLYPESQLTIFAQFEMMQYNFKKNETIWERDSAIERTVADNGYRKTTQTDKKPDFHHPEIEKIYQYGFDISSDIVEELLNLPEDTLIKDLEAVLEDSINRHEYLEDLIEEDGWDEKLYTFSVHAVCMLAVLESRRSLPVVINILRQGQEFLEYWYDERLEEFFARPISVLAKDQTSVLSSFIKEPDNCYQARNTAVVAAEIIALREPSLRNEIVEMYGDWIDFFLENEDDDRIIDTMFIGLLCWSCLNLNAKELLGSIRKVYEKDMVPFYILGTYEDVEKSMLTERPSDSPGEFNLFDHYSSILNNKAYINSEFDSSEFDAPLTSTNIFKEPEFEQDVNLYKNVGRNDPCPCGSGSKYKKCCLKIN